MSRQPVSEIDLMVAGSCQAAQVGDPCQCHANMKMVLAEVLRLKTQVIWLEGQLKREQPWAAKPAGAGAYRWRLHPNAPETVKQVCVWFDGEPVVMVGGLPKPCAEMGGEWSGPV